MHLHFIQHVHFETPGYLLEWAAAQQHSTSFTKIFEAANFPPPNSMDLLVIMGGPMGVYEEDTYTWLATEKAFIRSVIDAGKSIGHLPRRSTHRRSMRRKSISQQGKRNWLVAHTENKQ
ncbi:hypothetical protein [Paraflavitalea speifideaquila]|uniref:hypothetical protein n=1 Tax=Paraflavitalea speifideaquila TaxID=3076558 RepID=UPI0028E3E31D|nr:hypothetical protein [Paraflavitalea speifideiaquila]